MVVACVLSWAALTPPAKANAGTAAAMVNPIVMMRGFMMVTSETLQQVFRDGPAWSSGRGILPAARVHPSPRYSGSADGDYMNWQDRKSTRLNSSHHSISY